MKTLPPKNADLHCRTRERPTAGYGSKHVPGCRREFQLLSASLKNVGTQPTVDVVLLGNHVGPNLFGAMAMLRAAHRSPAYYCDWIWNE